MKFSIIIPTFNRCHLLWKVLLSLKNQTYSNFEVLIVDDGSTDKTKDLVQEFASDHRFIYIHKENGGAASARNQGLEDAIGNLITYIDSDEEVFPNYLEIAKEFFEAHPKASFGISNYNRVLEQYDNSLKIKKRIAHSSSQKDSISLEDIYRWEVKTCGTGIFHRKELNSRWDESFHLLEDLDFIMSLGREEPHGFLHIPYALFEYRQRYNTDGQCSLSNYQDFALAFKQIYDKHSKHIPLEETVYLGRFEKYTELQSKFESGEISAMRDHIFL